MKIEPKDRLYLLGFVGVLVKGIVMEPFEKASVTWVPPPWLLNAASILTVIAVLALAILFCLPNRKSK